MISPLSTSLKPLSNRLVRYADLVPCLNAFIDTRTPGSDAKENFTIIGPGVSENKDQHIHIAEPHGFNIGGARQPPGCTNSQHSHQTAEVFFVHSGTWRFDLGETGEDAQAVLRPGDLISIPVNVFRGFRNIGENTGFLFAVLGGDDPGRVLWAPRVFDMAREYGLILLEDGMLIDTGKGETIPSGKRAMAPTSRADVEALQRLGPADLEACIIRAGSGPSADDTVIRSLVGPGALAWPHGFTITEITLAPGAALAPYIYTGADVIFVHAGEVQIDIDGYVSGTAGPGDTLTIPAGRRRTLSNEGPEPARLVAVRGGDQAPAVKAA